MSVTEFTWKFEELSHYSSHNQYEGDEDWKINQYKYALRSEIDKTVGQQDFTCLYDMVRNSLVAEASIAKINREKGLVIERRRISIINSWNLRVIHRRGSSLSHP